MSTSVQPGFAARPSQDCQILELPLQTLFTRLIGLALESASTLSENSVHPW
jgi:hypothetical protein